MAKYTESHLAPDESYSRQRAVSDPLTDDRPPYQPPSYGDPASSNKYTPSRPPYSTKTPPHGRIGLRAELLAPCPSKIIVKQLRSWSQGDFIATNASTGEVLLRSDGKATSWSFRREFTDATGLPLFTMRRSWKNMSHAWWLELPHEKDGGYDRSILDGRLRWSLRKIKVDVTFKNAVDDVTGAESSAEAGNDKDVLLEVRGSALGSNSTVTSSSGWQLATIRPQFGIMSGGFLYSEKVWECDVDEGVDMGLIAVITAMLNDMVNNTSNAYVAGAC